MQEGRPSGDRRRRAESSCRPCSTSRSPRAAGCEQGWPIPTATDIAFALGVLAVFGRGLPNRLRVFLLALAVLDDLIAILIIAVFFTADPNLVELAARRRHGRGVRRPEPIPPRDGCGCRSGSSWCCSPCLTWWLVYDSGVHATIAGVALGLVMSRGPAGRVTHALEPWSNGVILPAVRVLGGAGRRSRQVAPSQLSPGVLGHPRGAAGRQAHRHHARRLARLVHATPGRSGARSRSLALVTISTLGGIGFTVSLLMNELAFAVERARALGGDARRAARLGRLDRGRRASW